MDDAYLGGERPGKRGRGVEHKFPFVAAVQTDEERHPRAACCLRMAEFKYRFNRCYDLKAIIRRFLTVAARTPPMPYRFLEIAEPYA